MPQTANAGRYAPLGRRTMLSSSSCRTAAEAPALAATAGLAVLP